VIRESALARVPRSLWVWSGLAITFLGFILFWAPQLLLLRALGGDPERTFAAWFAASGLRAFLAWNAGIGRTRVRGARRLRGRGPFVVVSNHESYLDSAILMAHLPLPLRLVSKAEIRAIPVLGAVAEVAGVIFAKRGDEDDAPASVVADAARAVRGGASVAFFPEGTRSRGRGILRFRKGAFEVARLTGVPVLPVVLVGTGAFMPPGSWLLGRFDVTLEVLAPRPVEGDDLSFRQGLREEMVRAQGRILAESGGG
jgi:1-acyl-sn-glycerol-3-phosphate acyltransferase